jgi:hypothetical protein
VKFAAMDRFARRYRAVAVLCVLRAISVVSA